MFAANNPEDVEPGQVHVLFDVITVGDDDEETEQLIVVGVTDNPDAIAAATAAVPVAPLPSAPAIIGLAEEYVLAWTRDPSCVVSMVLGLFTAGGSQIQLTGLASVPEFLAGVEEFISDASIPPAGDAPDPEGDADGDQSP